MRMALEFMQRWPAADVVEVVGAGSASIRRTKGSCGFVSIQTNIVIAGAKDCRSRLFLRLWKEDWSSR